MAGVTFYAYYYLKLVMVLPDRKQNHHGSLRKKPQKKKFFPASYFTLQDQASLSSNVDVDQFWPPAVSLCVLEMLTLLQPLGAEKLKAALLLLPVPLFL